MSLFRLGVKQTTLRPPRRTPRGTATRAMTTVAIAIIIITTIIIIIDIVINSSSSSSSSISLLVIASSSSSSSSSSISLLVIATSWLPAGLPVARPPGLRLPRRAAPAARYSNNTYYY